MRMEPSWMWLEPLQRRSQRAPLLLCHVRTQREDSCVWTRKKTLTRHWIYWCLDLGLPQPPELWDMNFCCLWAIQSIEFLLCNPNRLRHSLFLSGLWTDDLLSLQVALDFTIFSAANLSRRRHLLPSWSTGLGPMLIGLKWKQLLFQREGTHTESLVHPRSAQVKRNGGDRKRKPVGLKVGEFLKENKMKPQKREWMLVRFVNYTQEWQQLTHWSKHGCMCHLEWTESTPQRKASPWFFQVQFSNLEHGSSLPEGI